MGRKRKSGPRGKTGRLKAVWDYGNGCAVRLAMHGNRLGIAEGIETALRAGERFKMPVWAALNATMLAKWTPPESVTEVVVFGDNDGKFGGQAAAYACAHRLAMRPGIERVSVEIPPAVGADWADDAVFGDSRVAVTREGSC